MMESSPVILLMVGVEIQTSPSMAFWKYSRSA